MNLSLLTHSRVKNLSSNPASDHLDEHILAFFFFSSFLPFKLYFNRGK